MKRFGGKSFAAPLPPSKFEFPVHGGKTRRLRVPSSTGFAALHKGHCRDAKPQVKPFLCIAPSTADPEDKQFQSRIKSVGYNPMSDFGAGDDRPATHDQEIPEPSLVRHGEQRLHHARRRQADGARGASTFRSSTQSPATISPAQSCCRSFSTRKRAACRCSAPRCSRR